MSNTNFGQIKFASFNISTATTTTVVTAVTNASIVVTGFLISMTGTTPTWKFQDGGGGDLSGTFDAIGVYNMAGNRENPLLSTTNANGLRIVTTGTVSVRGCVAYYEAQGV